MGSNQYLLEWNQHLENFAENFSALRDQSEYVDCTLACEDGVIGAHRIILAGCSTYFQQLFTRMASPHPMIFLTNTRRSLVLLLMEFIYRGKTYVPQDKLPKLLELGRQLHIKGLIRVNTPNIDSLGDSMVSDAGGLGLNLTTTGDLKDIMTQDEEESISAGSELDEENVLDIKEEKDEESARHCENGESLPMQNGIDGPESSGPRRRGRPPIIKKVPAKPNKKTTALVKFENKDAYTLRHQDILILGGYAAKYGPEEAIKFARKQHKRNVRLSTILRYEGIFKFAKEKKKQKIEKKLLSLRE